MSLTTRVWTELSQARPDPGRHHYPALLRRKAIDAAEAFGKMRRRQKSGGNSNVYDGHSRAFDQALGVVDPDPEVVTSRWLTYVDCEQAFKLAAGNPDPIRNVSHRQCRLHILFHNVHRHRQLVADTCKRQT